LKGEGFTTGPMTMVRFAGAMLHKPRDKARAARRRCTSGNTRAKSVMRRRQNRCREYGGDTWAKSGHIVQ
jgi:hypothetical protein